MLERFKAKVSEILTNACANLVAFRQALNYVVLIYYGTYALPQILFIRRLRGYANIHKLKLGGKILNSTYQPLKKYPGATKGPFSMPFEFRELLRARSRAFSPATPNRFQHTL